MRRTLYAAAILAILAAAGCNKDDSDPARPDAFQDKGAIRYKNISGDLYDIYLDDVRYGNLYGNYESLYPNIAVGAHRVKAIQTEHISSAGATIRQQIVYVEKDSIAKFSFP